MRTRVSRRTATRTVGRTLLVLTCSLVLGGLTSFAQELLPGWISSFANSASGWTLLTVLLVWWLRGPWWLSALAGAAGFVLLTLGYTAVSTLRGFVYDPTFFTVIAIVVGPFVGLAACWVRRRDLRAAAATALLAGIGLGEAAYGLTVIGTTTSPVYWVVIAALSVALLAVMAARRLQRPVPVGIAIAGTAVVAALFNVAFSML